MTSSSLVHIKLELWRDGTRSSKILAKPVVILGRGTSADLQIDDPAISREHLKIENRDGVLYAIDLGSSNGSLLNKTRLPPNKATPIPEGAVIRPGTAKIKLIVTLVETRNLDEVDAELESLTTAFEDLAKLGLDKARDLQAQEEKLEQSIRLKQDKLVGLVDRIDTQTLRKDELEVQLEKLEPRLLQVEKLLHLQEPKLKKFWRIRKKQISLFQIRSSEVQQLSEEATRLKLNIENHELSQKRDRLKNEIRILEDSIQDLRTIEAKTKTDVESHLRLLEVRRETEEAELKLTRARLQKEIEEVEAKKTSVTSDLNQLKIELNQATKQLGDVRDYLANEITETEDIEARKSELSASLEEMEASRESLSEKISALTDEESTLNTKVEVKREELQELENFIVNRLAETEERCSQMEVESKASLDQQLEDTANSARELLSQELLTRKSSFEREMREREEEIREREIKSEKEITEKISAVDLMIAEKSQSIEEEARSRSHELEARLSEEERRRNRDLELSLQEERLKFEHKLADLEQESLTRQEKLIERSLKALASSALTTAALYIKSTTPNAATLLTSPELEEEVYTALRNTVTPTKSSKDSNPVLTRAHDLPERERRFWIRAGVGLTAGLSIIVSLSINPSWPGDLWRDTLAYFDAAESSSDYFLRRLREMEANRPKFLPEQNRQFKASYTENVLYSEGFLLLKTDEKVTKDWVLKLNKFLIKEFEVDEDVVARFYPIESRLLSELATQIPKISPNFVQEGVAQMKNTEQSFIIELEAILGGPDNFKKFWAFQEQFYKDSIEKLAAGRVPASKK